MPPDVLRKRLIWVTPKFPLGAPDGARHATGVLVRSLTRRGVDVDMVCLVPAGEPADPPAVKERLGVRSCAVLERSASRFLPLPGPRTPFTFRTFAAPDVRRDLRGTLETLFRDGRDPRGTVLVFDGLHGFAALEEAELKSLSARCGGVVYRAHNVETTLWEQCARRTAWPWVRWLFNRQAALVRAFEGRVARSVGLIAPVSGDDGDKFGALAPGVPAVTTAIGMEFPPEESVRSVEPGKGLPLLFVGRLDWLPNRAGLQWFLREVWTPLRRARPGASLRIAGTGDGGWLGRFVGLDGIRFLGRVERLEPLYESSALCIAPLFQGSGTRVKILEAARHARPVVTTALGAEGLGLTPARSYYRAEDRDEWLGVLKTVTPEDCRRMGLDVFREARARFDADGVAERFHRSLELLGPAPRPGAAPFQVPAARARPLVLDGV